MEALKEGLFVWINEAAIGMYSKRRNKYNCEVFFFIKSRNKNEYELELKPWRLRDA